MAFDYDTDSSNSSLRDEDDVNHDMGSCDPEGASRMAAGPDDIDGEKSLPLNAAVQIFVQKDRCLDADLRQAIQKRELQKMSHLCDYLISLGSPGDWVDELSGISSNEMTSTEEATPAAAVGSDAAGEAASPPVMAGSTTYRRIQWLPEVEWALFCCDQEGQPESPAAPSPAPMPPVSNVARHLEQTCRTLWHLLHSSKRHNGYKLPRSMQRGVLPRLYAWVVDWSLVTRHYRCWSCVVELFLAIGRTARTTSAADGANNIVVPWKPMLELVLSLLYAGNAVLPSWRASVMAARKSLKLLCRTVPRFFSADAAEGIWELTAPYLAPNTEGIVYANVLVALLPYQHLYSLATREVTPLATRLLQFFFVESAGWRCHGFNAHPAALEAMRAIFLGRLLGPKVILKDMDAYAEPIFSALLQHLKLPIGSTTVDSAAAQRAKMVPPCQAKDKDPLGWSSHEVLMSFTRIIYAFPPDNTASPLWGQLRRFIHATHVFVRPGSKSPWYATRVSLACHGFVKHALERMTWQRNRRHPPSAFSSPLASSNVVPGATAAAPAAIDANPAFWTSATVDAFLAILLPVSRSAWQMSGLKAPQSMVSLVALSASAGSWKSFLSCVDAGLRSQTEATAQRRSSVHLLIHCLPYVMGGIQGGSDAAAERRSELVSYLQEQLPLLLSFICPSNSSLSCSVLQLFAVAAELIPLSQLLPSPAVQEDFGFQFARLLLNLVNNSDPNEFSHGNSNMAPISIIIAELPSPAFDRCAVELMKEAADRSDGGSMCQLLHFIGLRDPERVMNFALAVPVPMLMDRHVTDAEAEWATQRLTAVLSSVGAAVVMQYCCVVRRCMYALLRHITSNQRRVLAASLFGALITALLSITVSKAVDDGGDGGDTAVDEGETGPTIQQAEVLWSPVASRVKVQRPSEAQLRCAVQVVNDALQDIVDTASAIEQVRMPCHPAHCSRQPVEGLYATFIGPSGAVAAAVETDGSCESAGPVTPQNVLVGLAWWLASVLRASTCLYQVYDAPVVGCKRDETVEGNCTAGASWPYPMVLAGVEYFRLPADCKLAFSRDEIFAFARRHLLQRMVGYTVMEPLQQCGLDIRRWADTHLLEEDCLPPLPNSTSGDGGASDCGNQSGSLEGLRYILLLFGWLADSGDPMVPSPWDGDRRVLKFYATTYRRLYSALGYRMPHRYWELRVRYLLQQLALSFPSQQSPQTFSDVLTILQLLSFCSTAKVGELCSAALEPLLKMLDDESYTAFFHCSRRILRGLTRQWIQRHPLPLTAPTELVEASPPPQGSLTVVSFESELHDGDISSDAGTTAATAAATTRPATPFAGGANHGPSNGDDGSDLIAMPGGQSSSPSSMQQVFIVQNALMTSTAMIARALASPRFLTDPSEMVECILLLVHMPQMLKGRAASSAFTSLPLALKKNPYSRARAGPTMRQVEILIEQAHRVHVGRPSIAVLLLTVALVLLHPDPQDFVAASTLMHLQRMTLSSYPAIRSASAQLAAHISLTVLPREPDAVALVRDIPISRWESMPASDAAAVVAAVQATYQQLANCCPLLYCFTSAMGDRFPLRSITAPQSFFDAAGVKAMSSADCAESNVLEFHLMTHSFLARRAADAAAHRATLSSVFLSTSAKAEAEKDSCNTAKSTPAPSWLSEFLGYRGVVAESERVIHQTFFTALKTIMASTCGAGKGVPLLLNWLHDTMETLEARQQQRWTLGPDTATGKRATEGGVAEVAVEEELLWVFNALLGVACAAVECTAPVTAAAVTATIDVEFREKAIAAYLRVVLFLCCSADVPNSALHALTFSAEKVSNALTSSGLWGILSGVLARLQREKSRGSITSGTTNEQESSPSPPPSAAIGRPTQDYWSQQHVRLLLYFDTLLLSAPQQPLSFLLPPMVECIVAMPEIFFYNPLSQVRAHAAKVLSTVVGLISYTGSCNAAVARNRECVLQLVAAMMTCANQMVFQGRLPLPSLQNGGAAEVFKACGDATAEASASFFPASALTDGADGGAPSVVLSTNDIAVVKVLAATLAQPPVELLAAYGHDILALFACSLDIDLPEVDDLHLLVESTVDSIALMWMPKALSQAMLPLLCYIVNQPSPNGASRRRKGVFTRALCLFIFTNLHRIGKYAAMKSVSAAALTAMAHTMGYVRRQGTSLFSVLTRVASEEQMRSILAALTAELQSLPPPTSAAARQQEESLTSPGAVSSVMVGGSAVEWAAARRRVALTQALCAVLLADPGAPPRYVPRLMGQLALYANEGNTEVGRIVKSTFEQWWRDHREGWEQEYKACFSAAQVESMSSLFGAPGYFV